MIGARINERGNVQYERTCGQLLLPIAFALCCLFAISVALFCPGYASDASILGMLVFLEIVFTELRL